VFGSRAARRRARPSLDSFATRAPRAKTFRAPR
jgi:hypothetical protein